MTRYILTEVEDVIPEPIIFEWDRGNLDKSFKKHGVTNEESEQVFLNIPSVLIEDEKHSKKEKRLLLLGKTDKGRLLSVIFTTRVIKKVRIISARTMSKKERKLYVEET